MTKKNSLILVLLAFFSCYVNAQTKTFIIKIAGIKIGTLSASHIKNGNFDYYVTSTEVDVFILKRIKISAKTEALYKDSILLKSYVKSNINGDDYLSKTIWKNNHYDINCHTHNYSIKDTTLTKPIKWSTTKLYFEKPAVGDKIYTESYGNLGTLYSVKNNGLKFVSPKSKQVYYYSKSSKLIKMEVVNPIKNFEIYSTDTLN